MGSSVRFINRITNDFPMLSRNVNGTRLVYLDSAATSLKPNKVISKINNFYNSSTSNVYRGTSVLSEETTLEFNEVRCKVADFIGANHQEVIFTSGATDSINKLSLMLGLKENDVVLTTLLEHHSNFLPWQCRAKTKIIKLDINGNIDIDNLERAIDGNTKLVAFSFASNVTGNIQDVRKIVEVCKKHSVLSLVDATQAAGHISFNVKDIDCDFLVFSAHKMLGPSGVGVLYVHNRNFPNLLPAFYGGGMVDKITGSEVKYKVPPFCFESGTPNIEGVLGFGGAIDYINEIGLHNVHKYLEEIDSYLISQIQTLPKIILPFKISKTHLPNLTFCLKNTGVDIGYLARVLSDTYGIVLNTGYQCCQPLYNNYGINGGIRVSCYLYNTKQDIDCLINALKDLEFML